MRELRGKLIASFYLGNTDENGHVAGHLFFLYVFFNRYKNSSITTLLCYNFYHSTILTQFDYFGHCLFTYLSFHKYYFPIIKIHYN